MRYSDIIVLATSSLVLLRSTFLIIKDVRKEKTITKKIIGNIILLLIALVFLIYCFLKINS